MKKKEETSILPNTKTQQTPCVFAGDFCGRAGCAVSPGKSCLFQLCLAVGTRKSLCHHPPTSQTTPEGSPGFAQASFQSPILPTSHGGTISQAAPARRLFAVVSPRSLCFVPLPRYLHARLSPTSATESSPSPCSMLSSSTCPHTATVSCSGCCSTKLGIFSPFHLGLPAGSSTSFQHFSESFFLSLPCTFSPLAKASGPISVVYCSCRAEPIPSASHLLLHMKSSTTPTCPWKTHTYLVFLLHPETLSQHCQMNEVYR